MSRGKEVKELREKMGMNRREVQRLLWYSISNSSRLGSREKRASGLFVAIVEIQSGNRASNQK